MKNLLTVLNLILLTTSSYGVAISTGNGLTGFHFPIYGPEPSNPYVQITGNGILGQPAGSTVYHGGLLSGSQYLMEFWIGPQEATDFNQLTLIRTAPFRSAPATPDALPNGLVYPESVTVFGLLAGQPAKLGVRVWDTATGVDFDSATIRGQGALFLSGPLGGVPLDNSAPLLNPNWVGESFSLVMVPEPGTLLLAGAGLVSLWAFRRQK